ncbi:MAG: transglutaminase family protein [Lachnospiraceae bacterium]|nr:transglutaminase family protein [Lachnospiraceae bacterium]
MKNLRFRYEMQLQFDAPVKDHHFTLKCMPKSNERQTIRNMTELVHPSHSISRAEDSFGNLCIYGYTDEPHTLFEVVVEGEAVTGRAAWETAEDDCHLGRYRYATVYTKPGDKLKEYYQQHLAGSGTGTDLERSIALMHDLYRDFSYVQGVTTVNTTAEEALAGGRGVCQDYAHIMIALCRMAGIPARYVVGMLIGEGQSHAWVEIYDDGRWYGLDPTNDLIVDDQHIRISVGRDCYDCRINQGSFRGIPVCQTQTIRVFVEEMEEIKW